MKEILMAKDTVSDSCPETEPMEQEQRNSHSPHSSLNQACFNALMPPSPLLFPGGGEGLEAWAGPNYACQKEG